MGEGGLIFLAINGVYFALAGAEPFAQEPYLYAGRSLLVTLIFQLTFYFFDLYDWSVDPSSSETALTTMQAYGVGCIVLAAVYTLFPAMVITMPIFVTASLAVFSMVFLWRYLYRLALARRMFTSPVLIVGTGRMASEIGAEIAGQLDSGHKIVAFVGQEDKRYSLPSSIPLVEDSSQIPQLCQQHGVERIVVALDDRRGKTPIEELLEVKLQGMPIMKGVTFFESLTGKILVTEVTPDWLIYTDGFKKGRFKYFAKRFIDVCTAGFGLLVASPVMLISALIIKLESPGGVFYKQERVGENGRSFEVIKFRSMRSDAEKDGPVWARQNDTRVTRYGGFIRKVRIDELPQMWNVLKGEMSFVGPRPERPIFVEQLEKNVPYYALRHSVKPGITGWAQVCYPYGASEEDALRKLEFDLYYIKNMSVIMDIKIIFQTVKTVLCRKGGR